MSEQISPAEQQHEKFLRLVRVDALLFTSTAAVIIITVLSTLARRSRNSIVKALLTILSTLYIPLITYTLVATEYVQAPSPLLIVSTVLLQLIFRKTTGTKVKIISRNNDDSANNIDRADYFNPVQHLSDAGWLGFLFSSYKNDALRDDYDTIYTDLILPATIVLAINVSSVIQTSIAKKLAIRSFAVGRNANLVAGYMAQLREQNHEQEPGDIAELPEQNRQDPGEMADLLEQNEQDPGDMAELREQDERELEFVVKLPEQIEQDEQELVAKEEQSPLMDDYPYLVLGEEKLERVITEKGYRLTIPNNNNEGNKKYITLDKIWSCERSLLRLNEKNREVCLSFALFKLLRLRFDGMQPSESNTERALNLVLNGPLKDHRRAFRVVEMELSLMDDYLYSELPFTYHGAFIPINILQCLCFLSSCCYIAWRVVQRLIADDSYLNMYYYNVLGYDLNLQERTIAILLYFDAIVCLIIVFVASCVEATKVVTYVFSYQTKAVLLCKYAMNKPCTRQAIEAIELLSPKKIVSFLKRKRIILKDKQLRQYSLCQEEETSIDLPDEVKKAVIDSIAGNGVVWPSPNYQNMTDVPGAKEACLISSYTERILIWHIATSHCEDHQPTAKPSIQSDNHRKVASSLSRYCAYLVASSPELLPDGTAWNQFIVEGARETAQSALGGWRTWWITKFICKIRKTVLMVDKGLPPEKPAEVHGSGKELGRRLIEKIEDEGRRWEMLAKLWTEMLLSIAPSDDLNAHAESIAKGGEFITHVWALLSNVGINECCTHSNDNV